MRSYVFFRAEIKLLPAAVPNNLPSILVTNFFSVSKIETAKREHFQIKKEASYRTERPHTTTAAPM